MKQTLAANQVAASHRLPVHEVWRIPLGLELRDEVDPFKDSHLFRPLHRAYTGDATFWSTPSPEPDLSDDFWDDVVRNARSGMLDATILSLAGRILGYESDGRRLLFVAILRAGVPVADWLCRLIPGSRAVAISLFVGLGMDGVALGAIRRLYPDRRIVFVDGWTGKGGVARLVRDLNLGPLAVLMDPWGWADFAGTDADRFCPSACFTGAATLGFSRTFVVDPDAMFAAYRFPKRYFRADVVMAWQRACPRGDARPLPSQPGSRKRFFRETPWRLHANEVCRALINADPRILFFLDDETAVMRDYGLLLALAGHRGIEIRYGVGRLADLHTRVACELNADG